MHDHLLSDLERKYLLHLARSSIINAVNKQPPPELDSSQLTETLRADGASFVTLTIHSQLRGCIGALEAYQPLVEDVREHAAAAAVEDYRFSPVRPEEVSQLHIEISRLSSPIPLDYTQPSQLANLLTPGKDGVVIRDGRRRATFLPQVWKELPHPQDFLSHLCLKMGAPSDYWKHQLLQVSIYRVEEFEEEK